MKKILHICLIIAMVNQIYASTDEAGEPTPGVSHLAAHIIKRFESFVSTVYVDCAGQRTIGYGHLVAQGENYTDTTLSEDEGRQLLIKDMRTKANIPLYLTVGLTSNQFDALTSLCFNIGVGAFSGSTVLQKVNAGDTIGAYEYFGHWRRAGGRIVRGLIKRRFAELMIFVNRSLDPNSDVIPSLQWGVAPMPITDENWGKIADLREEAVAIYRDYFEQARQ